MINLIYLNVFEGSANKADNPSGVTGRKKGRRKSQTLDVPFGIECPWPLTIHKDPAVLVQLDDPCKAFQQSCQLSRKMEVKVGPRIVMKLKSAALPDDGLSPSVLDAIKSGKLRKCALFHRVDDPTALTVKTTGPVQKGVLNSELTQFG